MRRPGGALVLTFINSDVNVEIFLKLRSTIPLAKAAPDRRTPKSLHYLRFTIYDSRMINMHAARTALNQDPELRQWAENWLKEKERTINQSMTDQEFEKHWLYVRPERMHEGAIEAVSAYAASGPQE